MLHFSIILVTLTFLASFNAVHGRQRYLGCFNVSNYYEVVKPEGTLTIEKCADLCLKRQKFFAVIQKSECRCALRIITNRVDLDLCNIDCGYEKCGGQNCSSVYVATVSLTESDEEKSQSTANFPSFEGCFGNSNFQFDELAQSWDGQNSNLRCAQHCRRDGYIISATRGTFCGCSDTLPSLMYGSAVDVENSTGENSQCNIRCGGMITSSEKCQQDECCGGSIAFTIYTTGEVNAVRQLLVNVVNALNNKEQLLLKKLVQLSEGHFFVTSTTDWINNWDKPMDFSCPNDGPFVGLYSEHSNYYEDRRFKIRCGQTNGLQAYDCVWTDYLNNFDQDFSYQCPEGKFIAGVYSYHEDKYEDRRWKLKCCYSQRIPTTTTCQWTGYINNYDKVMDFWASPNGNSYIQGIFSTHYNKFEDRIFKACVATVSASSNLLFSVSLRAKLNSYTNGGNGGTSNNVCVLKSTNRDHSCKPATNLGLHYIKIHMKNMKRLLVHGTSTSVEPLGEFDTEYDNSHSSSENKLTKTFQITKTAETSFSTEAGINMGIEIGTTIGAEANIFGQKVSTEVSASTSVQTSLTIGYSKSNSLETSESFETEVMVPAGKKVFLNLFKEKYELSVKWRANLEATGFVDIEVEGGKPVRVDIGEILPVADRDLYAFGTLLFGDRQKITAVTTFFESNGVVSKPPPPEPSITFNKTLAEKELTKKFGLTS